MSQFDRNSSNASDRYDESSSSSSDSEDDYSDEDRDKMFSRSQHPNSNTPRGSSKPFKSAKAPFNNRGVPVSVNAETKSDHYQPARANVPYQANGNHPQEVPRPQTTNYSQAHVPTTGPHVPATSNARPQGETRPSQEQKPLTQIPSTARPTTSSSGTVESFGSAEILLAERTGKRGYGQLDPSGLLDSGVEYKKSHIYTGRFDLEFVGTLADFEQGKRSFFLTVVAVLKTKKEF